MKKLVIIISAIIVIGIVGTVVGISYYRNTPDYVMKQYKKAYDTKDQELLESITCTFDQLELINIKEQDNKGNKTDITSYEIITKPTNNPNDIQKLYMAYKDELKVSNKEFKEFSVEKLAVYIVNYTQKSENENGFNGEIKRGLYMIPVKGKWKIILSFDLR